jgi:AraC-like DNA-binding protein
VAPRTIGCAIIGGARAVPYVRDVSRPVRSVGAQLRPGVAGLLLGASARELAGRHTLLDDVWGRAAGELREQLVEAGDPHARLDRFEAALRARLPRVRGVHPAVAHALARFATADAIADIVDEVGYSHRRFIALFDDAVGLTPKRYDRVRRMQCALAGIRRPLAQLAAATGYSDQAHLTREFRALVGLSPGEYRARMGAERNHVALGPAIPP